MIGAIAGDMIGAPYERSHIKNKDFEIVVSGFTDDTVLTVAVADAVLNKGDFAKTIKQNAQKYHRCGYGGRFRKWMWTWEDEPYGSFGNGSAMRVAPVGLIETDPERAFELACNVAAITHGHPSGYLAAGALAALICLLKDGTEILKAVQSAQRLLSRQPHHEECSTAIQKAVDLAAQGSPTPEKVQTLGAGWVAEEALAISVYCALISEDDYSGGTLLAVNHSGDSDSTGCITGHILGCRLGISAIPHRWVSEVELSDLITEISTDLWVRYLSGDAWYRKYPGW